MSSSLTQWICSTFGENSNKGTQLHNMHNKMNFTWYLQLKEPEDMKDLT